MTIEQCSSLNLAAKIDDKSRLFHIVKKKILRLHSIRVDTELYLYRKEKHQAKT